VPVPLGPTERRRGATPDVSTPAVVHRDISPSGEPAEIEIRWPAPRTCVVVVRGRPTRTLLTEARSVLWGWSPQDSLTIDVREAVLTRELFATLIAGRRRLRANGLFEIVGLDVSGARRIADRGRRRGPDSVEGGT
jgi:hypothetical protein